MTFWIVSAWSQVFHSWVLQCSLTQPQLVFQASLKVSTLKKQWDSAAFYTLVQNWFWEYDSTTADLLITCLWRNQLMFNYTQRSAATHLKQAISPLNCLSTSIGSVVSFLDTLLKKILHLTWYTRRTPVASVYATTLRISIGSSTPQCSPSCLKARHFHLWRLHTGQSPPQCGTSCLKASQLHLQRLDAPSQ